MSEHNRNDRQKPIPRSRIGRFSHVARIAGGVAGGILLEGARQLADGKRPTLSDMILTPQNAGKLAKQLSAMRGAAMKIGQLLSMETEGLLPKELSDVLAQLRDNAYAMPTAQLKKILNETYGDDWRSKFSSFDYNPIAAASIGQVHRATTLAGENIVLKIQYPGVTNSINSDVDNIAWLLRVSNLLPKHMEIDTLLVDAKAQLHDEADYLAEGVHLATFYQTLLDDERYIIPWYYDELSSETVLAMEYVQGEPIENLPELAPKVCDQLMHNLFELFMRELFELRLMQTDPNFANYRYQRATEKLVLLDFGATRKFNAEFVVDYKRLIRAVIAHDDTAIVNAADKLGYAASSASAAYREFLVEVFYIALEPFSVEGKFDFSQSQLSERLSDLSNKAYNFKEFWQTPPTDIVYLHRKLGGMFLLATRMGANVNCRALVEPWIKRLR